jgi:hypothetical protein
VKLINIDSLLTRLVRYKGKHEAFVIGEKRLNFYELNSNIEFSN